MSGSAQPASSALGSLDKYQLLKKIAHGGMAEIYAAKVDIVGVEKIVVVKRILPQLASDSTFISMFLDEARTAITLEHPNVVRTYDVGSVQGQYFIAMEYLHGKDLAAVLHSLWSQKRALPLEHALNICISVLGGLHFAHERRDFDGQALGIVHRDVSPQNMFITYDGAVKVVDFGIAKSTQTNETRVGTIKGKIRYMAPEQCRVEDLDRRIDVFACGVVLFEMTTGRRLFHGKNDYEVLKRILEEPIPKPSSIRPGYPPELEAIVLKALAKERDDRYATAQDFQEALEQFAHSNQLSVSGIALSRFMHELFGGRAEAWRSAGDDAGQIVELIEEKSGTVSDLDYEASELVCDVDIPFQLTVAARPVPAAVPEPSVEIIVHGAERGRRRTRPWAVIVGLVLAATIGVGGWLFQTQIEAAIAGALGDRTSEVAAARAETPTTEEPTTETPTTETPTTETPTTETPTTEKPTTETPTTEEPTTEEPTTETPTTEEPTTETPTTETPTTETKRSRRAELRRQKREAQAKKRRDAKRAKQAAAKKTAAKAKRAVVKAGLGELRIVAVPSCQLFVNGKSYGMTPVTGIRLPAKKYSVRLVNSRFGIDKKYRVTVSADQVTKRRYRFETD